MGKLGIILTVGIVGAIAAAGYAVYRNVGNIGGALSRGVETQLTVPFGNYLDTLWRDVTTSSINAVSQGVQTSFQQTQQSFIDAWNAAINSITGSIPTTTNPVYPWDTSPSLYAPPPTPTPTAPVPTPTAPLPTPTAPLPTSFKEGYYYFNFAGSQYDYQAKLTPSLAKEFATEAFSNPYDSFENIKYLGQSKLGPAGLKLFAQSQNYL